MAKRIIYKWRNKSLEEEMIEVNGKRMLSTRVVTQDAVIIVPILKGNKIVLERQYRKGVRKWVYELPAGGIEKGEKPIDAVRRELQEEVGYFPRKVRFLFKCYINPGLETEMDYFFLAEDLVASKMRMDEDETIKTKVVSVNTAIKMIKENRILDCNSLAGLLFYLYRKRG